LLTQDTRTTSSRTTRPVALVALTALALLLGMLVPGAASAKRPPVPNPAHLPVVFVHGNAGSAAQWQSQFQRFASNGYPQELLFAYEYDTSGTSNTRAIADLGPFIDAVLAKTGAAQVLLAAHSRGTSVSQEFLKAPASAAKVAKFANLDGARSATPLPVPTIAIWGEWNSLPNPTRASTAGNVAGALNIYNRDQGHTEVASSARTFGAVWEFFYGSRPATTDVVPEPPSRVTVAGRAVFFPQNLGFAGATLQVWEVEADTGERRRRTPLASYVLDATGSFGPLEVRGNRTYEFALLRPGSVHHFYSSPFLRDDHFVRLNSGATGTGLEAFSARSPQHAGLTLVRAREMWGNQGSNSDVLTVDLLGDAVQRLNVLTPATAPRTGPPSPAATGEVNALFLFDAGLDKKTDLSKGDLPPFSGITFLNAADVYLPASPDGSGTIRVAVKPRGGSLTEEINVPNWPSTTDRISISLRDLTQADQAYGGKR
jgi:pimeloyl-ACP methyl ester carboxylesterase